MHFLCLPTELRLIILEFSIGEHIIHVTDDSRTECVHSSTSDITLSLCKECLSCASNRRSMGLPGLTSTCRQLCNEATPILYRNTAILFSSTQDLCAFFIRNPSALARIRRVGVKCGPAKHTSVDDKIWGRKAFSLLQRHAVHLEQLLVCFSMYHNVHRDRYLLSNFWFHRLARIRGLFDFSLRVELDQLGPLNRGLSSDSLVVQTRVQCTEKVLRCWLTSPKGNNTRRHNVLQLQKDVSSLTKLGTIDSCRRPTKLLTNNP